MGTSCSSALMSLSDNPRVGAHLHTPDIMVLSRCGVPQASVMSRCGMPQPQVMPRGVEVSPCTPLMLGLLERDVIVVEAELCHMSTPRLLLLLGN